MSDIVETVAKAVYERLKLGRLAGRVGLGSFAWELQAPDDQEIVREAARAAIEAYEVAKKKAEEPYVTRVEKGVTYWSNGLCSQETPDWVSETSIITCPDGVQYKTTWSDFDKIGGPKLKIERQP